MKYLITEEWYEEDILDHGKCKTHATAYGLLSEITIKSYIRDMEKYSPYDYVDYHTYDSQEEYESMLKTIVMNGGQIFYEH